MEGKVIVHSVSRNDSSVLVHYGIKGTKWGVRNGPPYPLPYEAHTAAERKANPKSILDNYDTGTSTSRSKGASASKTNSKSSRSSATISKNGASTSSTSAKSNTGVSNNVSQTTDSDKKVKFKHDYTGKDPSKIPFKEASRDEVKKEAISDFDNALNDYNLHLSDSEKETLKKEHGIKSAEDYARYVLKDKLKNSYFLDDETTEQIAEEAEQELHDQIESEITEQYSDWFDEYDTLSDSDKERMHDGGGNALDSITNSEQYADDIAIDFIEENYGYNITEAKALFKSIKKDLAHSEIWKNKSEGKVLIHHGIAGQKWGIMNGPPYPLDYADHSAAEKRGDYQYGDKKDKPLFRASYGAELTGNKRKDKKIIKETYNRAKYAKAASMLAKNDSAKELKKSNKENDKHEQKSEYLKDQSAKANDTSMYFTEKFQTQAEQYASLYGKNTFDKFKIDYADDMTVKQAKKYIEKNKMFGSKLVGGYLGGAGGNIAAGIARKAVNRKEYKDYLNSL